MCNEMLLSAAEDNAKEWESIVREKDAEIEKLKKILANTLEGIEAQCRFMKDIANEGDKVICVVGQIERLIAIAHPKFKRGKII